MKKIMGWRCAITLRYNLCRTLAVEFVIVMLIGTPSLIAEDAPADSTPPGKIAFISDRDGDEEIYIMNPDGSDQTRITKQLGTDTRPSWSPDGRSLAFHAERDDFRIYVTTAITGEWKCLTPKVKNQTASDGFPVLSSDGKRILFMAYPESDFEIYVMNSDGSERKKLTRSKGDDTHPSWSPDGKRVVFASERDGNSEIYMMDADGTNQRRLTINSQHDANPVLSPDGRSIAFVSDSAGNYDIWCMDSDGKNQRRLTTDPANDACPSWSPDGVWLVFDSFRDKNHEIYIMKADGTAIRRLTTNPAYDASPSWSGMLSADQEVQKDK